MRENFSRVVPTSRCNVTYLSCCASRSSLNLASCLRAKWLFKPRVTPERMPKLREVASVSELGTEQFQWTPQKASSFHFEMQDGVVTVREDESKSESLFEIPGTAFDFFSDMHR